MRIKALVSLGTDASGFPFECQPVPGWEQSGREPGRMASPDDAHPRVFYFQSSVFPVLAAGLIAFSLCACSAATYSACSVTPPSLAREFRAAWVATVDNIDWPTQKGLTTAEQKAELLAILDRAAQLKLNAVIFQVRPACDALYQSALEPWSEYLTGTMGKAPQPFYDPLAFVIEQAHQRGLELHAWFNPYRAHHPSGQAEISPNHISRTRPELVQHYGRHLWLDPGEKEVQNYSLRVVLDVVRRYDVDGVHFDDYFYPYKERDSSGKELDFPDESSWRRFGSSGKLSRNDWRRQNVNTFIQRVYQSIKSEKPWVKFGISPFGIWRPNNPSQIRGFDAYENLYADSRLWLSKGWVDYFVPQLYWAISPPEQSFPVLLRWWTDQNPKGRLLVPGMDTTKTSRRWKPEEILNQISISRQQRGVGGHVHWNMRALMRNPALDTALLQGPYSQAALVPASPWLDRSIPANPSLTVRTSRGALETRWVPGNKKPIRFWVLQTRQAGRWSTQLLPGTQNSLAFSQMLPDVVALTAMDRYGNTSRPAVVERK